MLYIYICNSLLQIFQNEYWRHNQVGVADMVYSLHLTELVDEEVSGDEEEFMSSREHVTYVCEDNCYFTL